jgi:hypothetical protein
MKTAIPETHATTAKITKEIGLKTSPGKIFTSSVHKIFHNAEIENESVNNSDQISQRTTKTEQNPMHQSKILRT